MQVRRMGTPFWLSFRLNVHVLLKHKIGHGLGGVFGFLLLLFVGFGFFFPIQRALHSA